MREFSTVSRPSTRPVMALKTQLRLSASRKTAPKKQPQAAKAIRQMPADIWIPKQITEVGNRRQMVEKMTERLLPVLTDNYQKPSRQRQRLLNESLEQQLQEQLFPATPAPRIQWHLNFDQAEGYRQGVDFKLNLAYQPAPKMLWQKLIPWLKPKTELHLGESSLATYIAPNQDMYSPETQAQLKGLIKRQLHTILFALNAEYRRQHPAEFPMHVPFSSNLQM